eukprot:scaffold88430_cov58-Phaeocystis_antarctica.AAC.3
MGELQLSGLQIARCEEVRGDVRRCEEMRTSPSAKREMVAGVRGTPSRAEISSASSGELRVAVAREELHRQPAAAASHGAAARRLRTALLEELHEHLRVVRRTMVSGAMCLKLARAEGLLLETLLKVGAELVARAAQLLALVVLLHDLLEALGVDPHEGLQPAERAVRLVVHDALLPLTLKLRRSLPRRLGLGVPDVGRAGRRLALRRGRGRAH